jgi:hypothetical protein
LQCFKKIDGHKINIKHNQWLINKVSKQLQKGERRQNWAMTIYRQSISKHKQIIEKNCCYCSKNQSRKVNTIVDEGWNQKKAS